MLLNTTITKQFLKNAVGLVSSFSITNTAQRWLGLLTKLPGDAVPGTGETPSGDNFSGASEVATPNTTNIGSNNAVNYQRVQLSSSTSTSDNIMSDKYQSHSLGDVQVPSSSYARRVGNVRDITFNQAYNPQNMDLSTGADWGSIYGFAIYSQETSPADSFLFCGALVSMSNGQQVPTHVDIDTHDVFVFRRGCFELISENDGSISSCATGLALST